jgi:cellulose synthase (UDP-forming)
MFNSYIHPVITASILERLTKNQNKLVIWMIYFFCAMALLLLSAAGARFFPACKKILIAVNLIIDLVYLIWRITTIPTAHPLEFSLGILLLTAEAMGLTQFFIVQLLFFRDYKIEKKTLSDFHGALPTVDVLICTYNEPDYLLERTILAALNLEYDHKKLHIYVCDDGRRASIRRLCRTCGVGYITRPTNEHAKAGNINHALSKTSGELFAVLDADMICTKAFLKRTVGYFSDEDTAFVQTPQIYYNRDMYQRSLNKKDLPNEQDFFMREVQEKRAIYNAVLHVGTNVVFRRRYVIEIGMYPTFSITEDMAVGLKLQERGLRTVFINEPLVLGMSASVYADLTLQRDRWCRGNLQVMRRTKILRNRSLSPMQKLCYFDGWLYWFTCFQKMIYLLLPILFLLTTLQSLHAPIPRLAQFFVPYFSGMLLLFRSTVSNVRTLKWAHIYEIAMAPHMCMSILRELSHRDIRFKVTPKAAEPNRSYFQFRAVLPHLILLALSVLCLISGSIYLYQRMISLNAYLLNAIWCSYNCIGLLYCIRAAYHRAKAQPSDMLVLRHNYSTWIKAGAHTYQASLSSLSRDTLAVHSKKACALPPGTPVRLFLDFAGRINIRTTIRSVDGHTLYLQHDTLSFPQKKKLYGIIVECMRPAFDVKKHPMYL